MVTVFVQAVTPLIAIVTVVVTGPATPWVTLTFRSVGALAETSVDAEPSPGDVPILPNDTHAPFVAETVMLVVAGRDAS